MTVVELSKPVLRLRKKHGYSGSKIARQLNVPYQYVNRILRGEPPARLRWRQAQTTEEPEDEFPGFEHGYQYVPTSSSRCPCCGVLVQQPCLACWLVHRTKRSAPDWTVTAEDMTVELCGDELSRYLDVKHRRDIVAYRGYGF
jgi:transcriptional regulator with XRE-family HTH domain